MHEALHANLFPGALPHIADWEPGRLESRSHVLCSSQALCISVWGAIAETSRRRAIITDVLEAASIELDLDDEPVIECEVRGRRDVLNEYGGSNPTCPDVLVTWPRAVLTVESKFTEHLGGCSQVKPQPVQRPEGLQNVVACSGNHAAGSDLRTKTEASCRLTIKEGNRSPRMYWEVGAVLFRPDVLEPPRRPCPFRGGGYQLMRNLCFAQRLAELEGRPMAGFVLAYVAGAPSAHETEQTFNEFMAMLRAEVRPRAGAISYERVAEIATRHGETDLADWIERRLSDGLAPR
jgi:hypothetical protein